ncbi:MAG TPA: hypothetical protein VFX18_01140, partial [Candidatus Nitrosocosmicus sp.]|nr:hypothetical protein [Candidatus Nitrosocosmicus sp.]
MSIFWNVKEKERKSGDGTTRGPSEVEDVKKMNNQLKPFIKDNDTETEEANIRNDVLLEISTFLARR